MLIEKSTLKAVQAEFSRRLNVDDKKQMEQNLNKYLVEQTNKIDDTQPHLSEYLSKLVMCFQLDDTSPKLVFQYTMIAIFNSFERQLEANELEKQWSTHD